MIDESVKRAKSVTSASNFKVHMLFKSAITCLVLAVRLGVVVFVVFLLMKPEAAVVAIYGSM